MASFRTLLPAAGAHRPEDSPDDGPPSMHPHRPLLKRIRSVPQACQMCRQMKAKCDGGRPRCGNCIDRDRPCGYEGEAGQSRQAAMRSRLAAYENVFASLRQASQADSERLLCRLRVLDDPVAMLRETGGSTTVPSSASSPRVATASTLAAAAVLSSPIAASATGSVSDSGDELSASPPKKPAQMSPSGLHSTILVELAMPGAAVTAKALSEFYKHGGKLQHVFAEDEAGRLYAMLFGSPAPVSTSDNNRSIATACVASIVAVGMQTSPDLFTPDQARTAYNLAKHYFELVMEAAPFTAIKLATMLAIFNLMAQNTVALMWIGVGLKLCRTHGLFHKTPIDPIIALDEWVKLRRSWRILVCLSCWLSFTIGSISGQEVEFERVNPSAMEFEAVPSIEEAIEAESAKIAVLTVEILRVHFAFKEITVLSFESVLRDLQSWHNKLPFQLYLANLNDSLLSPETQREASRLHLMHLGAIVLVYRRMASQFSCIENTQASRQILVQGLDGIPDSLLRQGIAAARTTARILSHLVDSQRIPRRCWVVIIQAYTCCIVILHVVAQRQLHRCHPDTWEGDLQLARVCLQVLNYSGAVDDVAKEFHGKLHPVFVDLSRDQWSRGYGMAGSETGSAERGHVGFESVSLLLTAPLTTDPGHLGTSLDLMAMLGRPFRSLWAMNALSDDGRPARRPNLELPQLSECLSRHVWTRGGARGKPATPTFSPVCVGRSRANRRLQGASVQEQLVEACRRNNTDLLSEVLEGRSEDEIARLLNETTTVMGNHLYHEAAAAGNYEIIDMLLDQPGFECDPLSRREKDTPLHTVVRWSNKEPPAQQPFAQALVEMMLEAGSNPRLKNGAGLTATQLVDPRYPGLRQVIQRHEYAQLNAGDFVEADAPKAKKNKTSAPSAPSAPSAAKNDDDDADFSGSDEGERAEWERNHKAQRART
ncbi:ankyrin repeat protein [Grosmannia clavigera kw1407]|uniref:Ankyrin repeat protein n=1 Tax=Grosmannia clavigera (strain kw1407 / UAMH 11150) TaxID=655863 RepID=F0XJ13_GROCL|nr:ankyrin repeat protein [Grosmannia clavigera kw1407]EFX02393.1 ankyrin repeat protein [Grosmannia clavigera kw1407]